MRKKTADDILCENRVYQCERCGFTGNEEEAEEHQLMCDSPMRRIG
jgi:rubrerythrin